ncbi:PREDICTED: fas apoptotic inhibitory molecule 3 [Chinchilla lanigera]|uniref:fas apoptotic inhibitory molecule 3 n=1 Tax=Chinchilla lanigera TaxID=34839 RepID=UPI000697A099|nr:PREDICTED: fas apoptotic inhibitory molecule 3 [Chinchilla lanigera]
MNLWLWSLCFLPVSGALKILPEVTLDGALGGSVVIECPLAGETEVRMYLCRQMVNTGSCNTVVSNNFVNDKYRHRVALMPCSDKNQFLVELSGLTESDSGVYACGLGKNTDRGKTQKVTLNVHNVEYEPFLEEEPMSEPQKLLYEFLQQHMPNWLQMLPQARDAEFIPKVATPAQRTEAPPVHHSGITTPTTRQPRPSTASSAATAKLPTLLPSTTASDTSAQEGVLGPQEASYKHHSWLHRQRAFTPGSQAGREDQGFHILIPSVLGLLLLALLGLVLRRAVQRRRAFSRRIRRLAVRMRGLEASGRPGSRQPRAGPRPRSQNNIYSACPRRAPGVAAGPREAPPPECAATAPLAPPQVPETPWLYAPSHKTSCEYVTICHLPAAQREDPDSDEDDYINILSLTSLPSCPPGAIPWRQ